MNGLVLVVIKLRDRVSIRIADTPESNGEKRICR